MSFDDLSLISTLGQLIPFIIGIASLPSAIWGAFENWQEVKEEESHESQEMKEVFLLRELVRKEETNSKQNKIESQETQELLRSPRANEQRLSLSQ